MPSNLPLTSIVTEILRHTPIWVWLILAAITLIGFKQMRDQVVTRRRLLIAAVGLGAYSLVGAMQLFGARPAVALAWICGMAMTVAVNQWLNLPRDVRPEGEGRYAVRGSIVPLLAMWSVFALRYAVVVSLVFHPDWKQLAGFGLGVTVAYGSLSGVFLARALHILRSGSSPKLALA